MDNKDNNKPHDKDKPIRTVLDDNWKEVILRLGLKIDAIENKLNQLNK